GEEAGFEGLRGALRLGKKLVALQWREIYVDSIENARDGLPWLFANSRHPGRKPIELRVEIELSDDQQSSVGVVVQRPENRIGGLSEVTVVRGRAAEVRHRDVTTGGPPNGAG